MNHFWQGYLMALPDLPDPHADAAAEEYERRCESFDRLVCSSVNERGIAMPTNCHERGLINSNAKKVMAEILHKYPITFSEFREALGRIR